MSRKTRNPNSIQISAWIPRSMHQKLKVESAMQDCSRSWLITEALLQYFGMSGEDLEKERGYSIPKQFSQRTGNWTPNKKGDSKGQETRDTMSYQEALKIGKQLKADEKLPDGMNSYLAAELMRTDGKTGFYKCVECGRDTFTEDEIVEKFTEEYAENELKEKPLTECMCPDCFVEN